MYRGSAYEEDCWFDGETFAPPLGWLWRAGKAARIQRRGVSCNSVLPNATIHRYHIDNIVRFYDLYRIGYVAYAGLLGEHHAEWEEAAKLQHLSDIAFAIFSLADLFLRLVRVGMDVSQPLRDNVGWGWHAV